MKIIFKYFKKKFIGSVYIYINERNNRKLKKAFSRVYICIKFDLRPII